MRNQTEAQQEKTPVARALELLERQGM